MAEGGNGKMPRKEKKVFGSKGKLRLTEKKVRDEFN